MALLPAPGITSHTGALSQQGGKVKVECRKDQLPLPARVLIRIRVNSEVQHRESWQKKRRFSDVSVVCETFQHARHRVILAEASSVFDAALSAEFQELTR
jgi:hypothetical protein